MLKRAAAGVVPAVIVASVLAASYGAPTAVRGLLTVACTYTTPAPTVTKVTPAAGQTHGGTRVTITGTGFCDGVTSVTFGGIAATGVVVISDTKLTATSPAHAGGIVDVRVTNSGGTSAIAGDDKYRYVPNPYCALIDMSRTPTSWSKGTFQTWYVSAFNCGTRSWPATGTDRVDISVHFTTKAGTGATTKAYWLGNSYHNLNQNIIPNAYTAFAVTLNPGFRGTVKVEAEMIVLHVLWFGRYLSEPAQFPWVTVVVH